MSETLRSLRELRDWCNDGEHSLVYDAVVKSVFADLGVRLDAILAPPQEPVPATPRHDAGAYGRCSGCGRYSRDPRALTIGYQCDCGKVDYMSGSFKAPTDQSIWCAQPPAPPAEPGLREAATRLVKIIEDAPQNALRESIGSVAYICILEAKTDIKRALAGPGRSES